MNKIFQFNTKKNLKTTLIKMISNKNQHQGKIYKNQNNYLIDIKANSLRDWLNLNKKSIKNSDFSSN